MRLRLRDSGESEGAWVAVSALLWSRVTIELSRDWEIAEERGRNRLVQSLLNFRNNYL